MANCDFVLDDQYLLHDEPDDAQSFREAQRFGGQAPPRQEAGQALGEPEMGFTILGAIDGGLQFEMQSLLLTTEIGRSVAQLVNGDQLLLIGIDQAVDAFADPDQTVAQVSLALLVWIEGANSATTRSGFSFTPWLTTSATSCGRWPCRRRWSTGL